MTAAPAITTEHARTVPTRDQEGRRRHAILAAVAGRTEDSDLKTTTSPTS
jgi:hypothetical protein